ncbi:MAG: P-loop NTPase fold protein, partial [Planctomycetota bacterium]
MAPLLARRFRPPPQAKAPPLVSKLETEFSELVDALCPRHRRNGRATLFVDDLDRCTGVSVTETLRAIGVLLNRRANVTIVFSIDRDRVAAALASEGQDIAKFHLDGSHHYDATDEDDTGRDEPLRQLRLGHRYLEKFIEATFRLPSFDDSFAYDLMRRVRTSADDAIEAGEFSKGWHQDAMDCVLKLNNYTTMVRRLLDGNPRRLKQWQNEVYLSALSLHAVNRLKLDETYDDKHINLKQLAKFQALLIAWPRFLRDLSRYNDLLKWIAAYALVDTAWPESWELGNIGRERWGYNACLHWRRELDRNEPLRTALAADEPTGEVDTAIARPSLVQMDVNLLLELQRRVKPSEESKEATKDGSRLVVSGSKNQISGHADGVVKLHSLALKSELVEEPTISPEEKLELLTSMEKHAE